MARQPFFRSSASFFVARVRPHARAPRAREACAMAGPEADGDGDGAVARRAAALERVPGVHGRTAGGQEYILRLPWRHVEVSMQVRRIRLFAGFRIAGLIGGAA